MKRNRPLTPATCPVCGEDVPRNAVACPECGADHNSGWREDVSAYDGVDLPEEFDYDDFAQREFGRAVKPRGISAVWWITAVILLLLTALYFALGR